MKTKISVLREHMDSGNWPKAISLAAKFPRLGEERGAILDAQLALTNPAFCRAIHKDPEQLVQAGIVALRARYP